MTAQAGAAAAEGGGRGASTEAVELGEPPARKLRALSMLLIIAQNSSMAILLRYRFAGPSWLCRCKSCKGASAKASTEGAALHRWHRAAALAPAAA